MPSTSSGNILLSERGRINIISAIFAFLILPFFFSFLPFPTHAQTNPSCFTKEECAAAPYNGRVSTSEASECAGEPAGRKFYCYAPEPLFCPPGVATENCQVKLAVSIGGQNISGLGNYIAAVYSFLLSIAGILAGIMITVAGFEWLLAAGSSEKITHAKKRIQNAIIGMVLALGSYVILQTVNPALTTLSLPPVKLTRRIDLKSASAGMGDGSACFTKRDAAACPAACAGCTCFPVQKDTLITDAIKLEMAGIAALLSVGVAPLNPAVFHVVKTAALQGVKWSWSAVKLAARYPKTTLVAGAAGIWVASGSDDGEPGICMVLPTNLSDGSICDPDRQYQCASKKCLKQDVFIGWGTCTSGKEATACKQNSDCETGLTCEQDNISRLSWCVKAGVGKQTGFPCDNNAECQTGVCSTIGKTCVTGTMGSPCGDSDQCAFGFTCVTMGNVISCQKKK